MATETMVRLSDIEACSDSNVYVVNMGMKYYKTKTDFLIPQDQGDGTKKSFTVPSTWVPVNIGEAIPKEMLLKNMHFRSLVSRGLLKLLTTDQAESILAREDAQMELQRVHAEINQISNVSPNDIIQTDEANKNKPKLSAGEELGPDTVNPMVYDILSRDDLDDSSKASNIRTIADALTKDDWQYIQASTTNKGLLNLVKQYMKD